MAAVKIKKTLRAYLTEIVASILISLAFTIASLALFGFKALTPEDSVVLTITFGIVDIILILMAFMNKRTDIRMEEIVESLRAFGVEPCSNEVARKYLDKKADEIKYMNDQLNKYGRYSLDKTRMYRELTELTDVMSVNSGDEIVAVSSINIEDWESAHAQVYLEAQRKAIMRGIPIRRLFFLDENEIKGVERKRYLRVIQKNYDALKPPTSANPRLKQSGIRWLYKQDVAGRARNLDMATFADSVLMMQLTTGEYEFVTNPDEVKRNLIIYQNLWNSEKVKTFEDLRKIIQRS